MFVIKPFTLHTPAIKSVLLQSWLTKNLAFFIFRTENCWLLYKSPRTRYLNILLVSANNSVGLCSSVACSTQTNLWNIIVEHISTVCCTLFNIFFNVKIGEHLTGYETMLFCHSDKNLVMYERLCGFYFNNLLRVKFWICKLLFYCKFVWKYYSRWVL